MARIVIQGFLAPSPRHIYQIYDNFLLVSVLTVLIVSVLFVFVVFWDINVCKLLASHPRSSYSLHTLCQVHSDSLHLLHWLHRPSKTHICRKRKSCDCIPCFSQFEYDTWDRKRLYLCFLQPIQPVVYSDFLCMWYFHRATPPYNWSRPRFCILDIGVFWLPHQAEHAYANHNQPLGNI